ncbi:MAG: LPS export ABC transporter periplasmic protein LptC [Thiotrichales bacterium]|nr:LPS export ABC transporter periplasmic protein LptC [Thiotrichales bacterium]
MTRFINRGNVLIFIVVLLLALASLWLRGQARDPAPVIVKAVVVPHIPDFTIEEFDAVAMDVNGQLRQSMSAPKLLHYADDQTATVDKPHLVIYNAETPPWQVDAERGWLSADGNTLQLLDKVVAVRERNDAYEGINIDTSNVDVDLLTDTAVTDEYALIIADSGVTESVGMRAHFAKNRLFLKSRVRGHYAVPGS